MVILLAGFICLWVAFLLFALELFVIGMILVPIVLVITMAHVLIMIVETAGTAAASASNVAIAIADPPGGNRPRWRFAAAYNEDVQLPIFAELTLLIIGIVVAIVVVT